MKIPKKVKIGGLTYTVKVTQNISLGVRYSGEVIYSDLQINLRPSQRIERDFLHEVIHAIYDNLGISEHDDIEIDRLAGALYALIVDNPGMFEQEHEELDLVSMFPPTGKR